MIYKALTSLCVWLCLTAQVTAQAQPKDTLSAYFFGNSLVNHISETDPNTNVPYWMNVLAQADGRSFATDGQFGFVRNFAETLPPQPNWSFPGVSNAWNTRVGGFGSAGFDAVVLNTANFIQYQSPNAPYDGDNPTNDSPVSATLKVWDWIARESPDTRFYIYEGWAEMAGVVRSFPPNKRNLRRFHNVNQGDYHDWYVTYRDELAKARPDLSVRLIPVASTLSYLLSQAPLSDIDALDLYSDDAPHGTSTLYFMAALITYAALYEVPPPASLTLPDEIHPIVRDMYPWMVEQIWTRVEPSFETAQAPVAEPTEAPTTQQAAAAPVRPAVSSQPAVDGVPALAMGLNGIADWSTQHPFINVMKTSRPWIGHLPAQWGGFEAADLQEGGHLNENGWPISMPENVTKLETFIFTDQPLAADYLDGAWLVRYEGSGDLTIGGRARNVLLRNGEGRFTYKAGDGPVSITLNDINPDDPIRNIAIFKQEHLPHYEAGVLFNPVWIDLIKDLRSLRFMDWMQTNGSIEVTWDDRPKLDDYTWVEGVPLEVMVALANQIGADPWFNMPHMADDTYVRNFATLVRDTLEPNLIAYVEYSNEVWNFIFPQAVYARDQAETLWGKNETGWMQFYGMRAAQVMDIWTEVFEPTADSRLMRTMATHTGWQGLEELILQGDLAREALGKAPQDSFDAYAVTGYFGFEMGGEEFAPQVNAWLDEASASDGWQAANAPVANALREGSLKELIEVIFPYHALAASNAGLDLVMYEGGTHVAGHGPQVSDERMTAFFTNFNYSPEMASLYADLLQGWTNAGGKLFNAFVDVAPASQWGSWGSLRHLNDSNARWDTLMAFNAAGDNGWQNRAAADFADGRYTTLSRSGETLEGTLYEDIVIGGPGEDSLISSGGDDIFHGGEGYDTVIVPGTIDAYNFSRTGTGLKALSQFGNVTLVSVEAITFSDEITIDLGPLLR